MPEATTHRPGERIFLWLLLAFSVFVLITALAIPNLDNLSSSGMFPTFVGGILILSALRILGKNRERYASVPLRQELRLVRAFALPCEVVGYAAILLLYILTTSTLGFVLSSYLFLVGSFVFLRAAPLVRSLIISAVMLAAIYLLFQTIFKVMLW